jgi:hypothetical protein
VLNIGENSIRFITSTGLEVASFDSTNRPNNVFLSNFTIKRVTGQFIFSGLADSVINNIKFKGEYNLGNAVAALSTETAAVFWNNDLAGTKVTNLKFKDCVFDSNSISIKCNQTAVFDTTVKFDSCRFFINDTAIYIAGVSGQGNNWTIMDTDFEEIATQAFRSTNGKNTQFQECRFINCGNQTSSAASPTDPIIYFGEKINNVVVNCSSNRFQSAAIVSSALTASIVEVYNGDKTKLIDRNYSLIYQSDSFRPLAIFSAFNNYLIVDYVLKLGEFSRTGQLYLTVGDGLSEVAITDRFQYSTPFASSYGGTLMTNFEFSAELRDNDADSGIDTVVLSYKNPILVSGLPGATGSISFDVTYGV